MSTAEAAVADANTLADLSKRLGTLEQRVSAMGDPNSISMVVFSGDLDRLMAAFVMATGSAACGMKVTMFFTFWGIVAMKKAGPQAKGKRWVERMFGWMMPGGFHRRKLSKFDFGGVGRRMMLRQMSHKNMPDLPTLINLAGETGVEICVCDMARELMGIRQEELIDYPNMRFCGVARFLETSSHSGTTLFI